MNEIALFIVTLCAFGLAFAGLALGLLQNKPLKGSCGGLSTVTGERCNICGAASEDRCEAPAEAPEGRR